MRSVACVNRFIDTSLAITPGLKHRSKNTTKFLAFIISQIWPILIRYSQFTGVLVVYRNVTSARFYVIIRESNWAWLFAFQCLDHHHSLSIFLKNFHLARTWFGGERIFNKAFSFCSFTQIFNKVHINFLSHFRPDNFPRGIQQIDKRLNFDSFLNFLVFLKILLRNSLHLHKFLI